jgi:hypothetical protein
MTHNDNKLSNNEEAVIRLLYSETKTLQEIFTPQVRERLIDLNLINLKSDGTYNITDKALSIIENGGFIIKYPLSTDTSVVMNFRDTLLNMSKPALKALALSIKNTEVYKQWGKFLITEFYHIFKDSIEYYKTFDNPLTRLDWYKSNIEDTEALYERQVNIEFSSIENFDLTYPIDVRKDDIGRQVTLTKIIDNKTGEFLIAASREPIVVNFDYSNYYLPLSTKHKIIKQYYTSSKKKQS